MDENRFECSVAIQVLPQVDREDIIPVVDKVIGYIKETGLNYVVGPFETTVEGEFGVLMDLIRECQLICIREGAPQVASYVKIYYNPYQGVWSMKEKTEKHQRTDFN